MPEAVMINEATESFHVYLSQYFKHSDKNSLTRQQSVQCRLPTIDKRRDEKKRTSFRLAIPRRTYPTTNISTLTARGKRPESNLILREDLSQIDRQVPPPSPSDEQIEHIFQRFHQISPPLSPSIIDGYVPYRLPALNSVQRQRIDWNISIRQPCSSFDHY